MKALVTRFLRSPALSTLRVPTPEPGELLIKVAFVALNPTDCMYTIFRRKRQQAHHALGKHASVALPPAKVIGCEFSGTVVSRGRAVEAARFSEGDRVAGVVHGCKYSHTGAFAEQLVTDANVCFHVPESIPLEQACTLGVGWLSAAQALAQRLYADQGLDTPDSSDTLLIYSAATSTGLHTVQQARIERPECFIIAIASPQHEDLLKRSGANAVFDYRSPTLVADVRALGRNITRAFDCYSEGDSTSRAAQCMLPADSKPFSNSQQRRIVRTLPPYVMKGTIPPGVRADEWILAYTALGKPFWFLFRYYAAAPADYETATAYIRRLPELLSSGVLKPVPHRLMPGGLKKIGEGFAELKAGRVKGEKLVYRVAEADSRGDDPGMAEELMTGKHTV